MEYEVSSELNEQAKAVVIHTKVKLTANDGDKVDEKLLVELLNKSADATIGEYKRLRPFADGETNKKG